MAAHLLDTILEIGDHMKNALENEDVEHYLDLVAERGTLVDALLSHQHPSEVDENWEEKAKALSEQNDALMEVAEAHTLRLRVALERVEKVKGALRSYHRRPGERTSILNGNLRV